MTECAVAWISQPRSWQGIVTVSSLLTSSAAQKAPRLQNDYGGSALQDVLQTIKLVVYQLQLADINNAENLAISGIVTPLDSKEAVNSRISLSAEHRRLKIVKLVCDKITAWKFGACAPGLWNEHARRRRIFRAKRNMKPAGEHQFSLRV